MVSNIKYKFFVVLMMFYSCSDKINKEEDFLRWLNNDKNGLVKRQRANNFILSMKYMPSNYLDYIECKNEENKSVKGVNYQSFNNSLTFLFMVDTDSKYSMNDITRYDVYSLQEYKSRINKLNFFLKDHIYLKVKGGGKIKPVLTSFQNIYEINNRKIFYIVFQKDAVIDNLNNINICFEDVFLDTGVNQFLFRKEDIDNIPKLNFIKE